MDILVLSNDLMERSVIQQVLEKNDHKVVLVENTEEAWKHISENALRFVIADATAQEKNVHQLIQRVRSNPNLVGYTYILLLITKGQNGNLIATLGVGTDDYLNKPITPQELKTRVAIGVRILSMNNTLSQSRDQIDGLAMFDDLTGLMNRQAYYRVAQGELERARRLSDGVSVIVLDIDNFHAINDRYGSNVGESVLQIVAQVIREKSRPYDCIGRWDVDQFTLTLPSVVSTDAEKIAKRILAGVRSSGISLTDGPALDVKLSGGIASTQNINAYAEIDTFIQSAEQAMKSSRQNETEEVNVVII